MPEVLTERKKIGAPSLYRDEYPQMLIEYFQARQLAIRAIRVTGDSESLKDATRQICSEVPTFQGFAESIGVSPDVLQDWAKTRAEFGRAHARAKSIQAKFFADGLTSGVMNPTGGIFVAKNLLGWRDRIDVEQTVTSVDSGNSLMRVLLSSATPDMLSRFRACLDDMRQHAIATGQLSPDGQLMTLQASANGDSA